MESTKENSYGDAKNASNNLAGKDRRTTKNYGENMHTENKPMLRSQRRETKLHAGCNNR